MAEIRIIRNTIPAGVREVVRRSRDVREKALWSGIKIVRSKVAPRVPIDTGRSQASMEGMEIGGGVSEVGDSIAQVESYGDSSTGYVGTNVDYFKFFEFGTIKQNPQFPFTKGLNAAEPILPKAYAKIFKSELGKII